MKLSAAALFFALGLGFFFAIGFALHVGESVKAWVFSKDTPKDGPLPEPDVFVTPAQALAKDTAVTQCNMERKVPVMGFNLKVVCLDPSGKVAWVR